MGRMGRNDINGFTVQAMSEIQLTYIILHEPGTEFTVDEGLE